MIGIIAAIIILVAVLPVKPSDLAPEIGDSVEIKEETVVELGTNAQDSPQIRHESSISETESYLDENGTKHYVIEAEDSPTLGD